MSCPNVALNVRRATRDDLPRMLEIYAFAREQMIKNGNPHQWGTTRPAPETVRNDIDRGISYVVTDGNTVVGCFAFFTGHDETYDVIENGAWLNDAPYGVIHRIASAGTCRGILRAALAFADTQTDNIRIDTHEDNKIMRGALAANGFTHCGTIYTDNGTARLAFQRKRTTG